MRRGRPVASKESKGLPALLYLLFIPSDLVNCCIRVQFTSQPVSDVIDLHVEFCFDVYLFSLVVD